MYRNSFVLVIIGSVMCFLYGLYNIKIEVEPNACRMTYMFGQPMYSLININQKESFPNYKLYYYYEGYQKLNAQKIQLSGAPVIFVPGNAGSYKQVRSLASVALRKGMDNKRGLHLDYFTVDFDEELSGLFGGYLYKQQEFLKVCIDTVLRMYDGKSKIVLIGHSMGGKVAQSVLLNPKTANHINTIISISTPMDRPVLNMDPQINHMYQSTHDQLIKIRTSYLPSNSTNVCCFKNIPNSFVSKHSTEVSKTLDNIMMISTGGGNRDLLVRGSLTISQFSDIHAMTSSIPKVGLSCDHLSAVWCLQFMLVINRYLFSITQKHESTKFVVFNNDKTHNFKNALHYFVHPHSKPHKSLKKPVFNGKFHFEQRKMVFNKRFDALQTEYNQFINIIRDQQFKFQRIFIEVFNYNDDDWLYACTADPYKLSSGSGNIRAYCGPKSSLAHHIRYLTAGTKVRTYAELDLHKLQKSQANATHILVQLPPSYKPIGFNIDMYDSSQRTIVVKFPLWYSITPKILVPETMQDTLRYKLKIVGLIEPFQAVRITIEPHACSRKTFEVTTKLCIPWAQGFDSVQTINESNSMKGLYVNVPLMAPRRYNTTENPVELDIFLDPACRFSISYQYSLVDAMSRLVRDFYSWMPANLITVLIIVLRKQIGHFEEQGSLKSLKPYTGYFQLTSLFIVTACRLLKKVLSVFKLLPQPENLNYAIHISIIVHSTAIAISILGAFIVWWLLIFNGNIIYTAALRLTRLRQTETNILVTIITHLPMILGVLTIAIALGTCSGVALLFACIVYFIMISNAYKDNLEDLLWTKAVNALKFAANLIFKYSSKPEKTKNVKTIDDTNVALTTSCKKESTAEQETSDNVEQSIEESSTIICVGLQNFPYHMTLFLLLCVYTGLNGAATVAWIRGIRSGVNLPDPILVPTLCLLASLTLLLQMNAPNKIGTNRFMSAILYICGAYCVMYCQEAIYRLYYVISFCFAALAGHESLYSILGLIYKKNI